MCHQDKDDNSKTRHLITNAISGDPLAISALYDLYKKRLEGAVHARLGRKLRSKMETIDLVQSVWKDALVDIDEFEYRGPDSFFHWMLNSVFRKIKDKGRYFSAERRDPGRERRILPDKTTTEGSRPPPAKDPTPSQAAITEEEKEQLLRLLAEIPELQQKAVILKTREKLKFEEIGKALGKSTEAARKLYSRGMKLLQERIERENRA